MSRGETLALVAITAALVLAPMGIELPGMPMVPRGDEPTYRLMTESLLEDGDLRLERHDLRRLFESFPFAEAPRLMLVEDEEGLRFAPRALYPLLTVPWTALLGDAGPGVMNGMLLALCLVLGSRRLSRGGGPGGLLVTTAFVLLSSLFVYTLQPRPELLAAALVWLGLDLAWSEQATHLRAGLAGLAVALAAAITPLAAAAALPLAWRIGRHKATALLTGALGAALALGLAAAADGYYGTVVSDPVVSDPVVSDPVDASVRFTAVILNPLDLPAAPGPDAEVPVRRETSVLEATSYLLIGRHAGFFVYFPLGLVFVLLAALAWRRDRRKPWDEGVLLASFLLAAAAAAILTSGSGHRLDPSGDAVASLLTMPGNRLLTPLYPLFFFLIRRPGPLPVTVAGGAWAAATLGALLITPFGMPTAGSTVQSHTRGWPIRGFPLELAWIDAMPDYRALPVHGGRLWSRRDEVEWRGDQAAVLGGIESDLWLETAEPLTEAHFALRNLAVRNRVTVRLGAAISELSFEDTPAGGRRERLRLEPGPPQATLPGTVGERFFYRFRIATARGERPIWRAGEDASDYVGVEIAYLGTDAYLEQDVYAVDWLGCGVPSRVVAGERFAALVRLRNASAHPWSNVGAARVRLAARWRTSAGREAAVRTQRAELGAPLAPGAELARWLALEAPEAPGTYVVAIEPVFENVAWWSDRGASPCTAEITVEPSASPLPNPAR